MDGVRETPCDSRQLDGGPGFRHYFAADDLSFYICVGRWRRSRHDSRGSGNSLTHFRALAAAQFRDIELACEWVLKQLETAGLLAHSADNRFEMRCPV